MALGMEAIDYPYDLCREFAKPHQLVHAEVSEVSIPNLLAAYLPLSDCTCGKQKQRSPNYVPRRVNAE
jgi:putative hemolysin